MAQKVKWISAGETLEEGLLAMMVCGGPDDILAGLRRFTDVGVDRIILGIEDHGEIRRFAEEVMPKLRASALQPPAR